MLGILFKFQVGIDLCIRTFEGWLSPLKPMSFPILINKYFQNNLKYHNKNFFFYLIDQNKYNTSNANDCDFFPFFELSWQIIMIKRGSLQT